MRGCCLILCVLLLAAGLCRFEARAALENRDGVAVIIGNSNYGTRAPRVEYAGNDARAMRRFVIDVLGYREGNVIDIRDATKAQIESVFGTSDNPRGRLHNIIRDGKSDAR
jgi:hypothetical protein